MIVLKNIVDKISGMRFMIENLEICSSMATHHLLSQHYYTSNNSLSTEFDNIESMLSIINNENKLDTLNDIKIKLSHILDIKGTINNISNAQVLDDIQLFEIKRFAILVSDISILLNKINCTLVNLPNVDKVIEILDPDKKRISHFYIYPSYNSKLSDLRKKYESVKNEDPTLAEEIRLQCLEIEDKIRMNLSRQLLEFANNLMTAIHKVAYLDILIAKANQAKQLKLTKPTISKSQTNYKGIFNPQIKHLLNQKNKDFQHINICLHNSPCLITGANMAGKTVVLKTVSLAQYLFQFGFYVPAQQAEIKPVEDILLSIGDDQSEMTGLSSFAAEMLTINTIIKAVKSEKNVLILIDELARTTNPQEGGAIVNATIDILNKHKAMGLITTHYSGLNTKCRKLRVKGLIMDKLNKNITIENINDFMDYSLIENNDENVPMEALKIAEVLGVDNTLLKTAKEYI